MIDEMIELTAKLRSALGTEAETLFARQIDRARESGVEEHALRTGDTAPEFRLPDASGTLVESSRLLEHGPIVLIFYRGGWCRYCNIQLRAFQKHLSEIRALGGQLVAISPETPDNTMTTREREALEFFVLSDSGNSVARAFGLTFELAVEADAILKRSGRDVASHNASDRAELPVPTTYVIGKAGIIAFAMSNVDYRTRVTPEKVIGVLTRLSGEQETYYGG